MLLVLLLLLFLRKLLLNGNYFGIYIYTLHECYNLVTLVHYICYLFYLN